MIKKLIFSLCLSATILSSVQAFAVADHNKPISSWRLKYCSLKISENNSANGKTEFVLLNEDEVWEDMYL